MGVKDAILDAYRQHDKDALMFIQKELQQNQDVLNVFFEEYLEVFSDQMNVEDQKSPVWVAYKDKFKEHEDICANLKLVQYYLGK